VTSEERAELLGDEWLIVRHSGEIPEITYHSSLYFLTEDGDGPRLRLTEGELQYLKDAAIQRYHEIVLRDIIIENFHKTIYRGVRRTLYNWHRCKVFEQRQSIPCDLFQKTVANQLLRFLEQGVAAAGKDLPQIFINCSVAQLYELAAGLGIETEQLPSGISEFCLEGKTIT